MSLGTPQLRPGDLVELEVSGLAFGGRGIARLDDFVIFVAGAVPGDAVRARVTKYKRRYAEAKVEEILGPSPRRRPARCSSFGSCGGCVWQNLDYGAQLEYKAAQVRESLEHLGGLKDFTLAPIVGMAEPWHYRNRADFSVGHSPQGAVIGFRPAGRWDSVLPLSSCHLVHPEIEAVRATVESWLRESCLPGWDPRTHTGYVRHLLVRTAQLGKEVLVSLVTAPHPGGLAADPTPLPGASDLVARLRAAHPHLVGILHAVNRAPAELSFGLESTVLWGRPYLLEKVAGLTLKVSVDAFFQTNTLMAHVLYGLVAEAVERASPRAPVVWDLYSGVGSIALAVASRAQMVVAIEENPRAVADARENARLNGVKNVFFLEGDVAKVLRELAAGRSSLPQQATCPNVIIVDPPRAGLSNKALARLAEIGAPSLVYVSCNPTTMAPNVAYLAELGYRLRHVTPVDMFPHTPHVEAVAVLELKPTAPSA